MRSRKVLAAIALLCLAVPSNAENIFHHKKEIAVVALHIGDAITTHMALNNPCQCFHEGNPLAPGSGSWGSQIAFHAALGGVALGGAYLLRHHNAPKPANFILWESIAVESFAVTNNAIALKNH
jgi:hypothetical protein